MEQGVVEPLELLTGRRQPAGHHAREGGVGEQAATQHHMARRREGRQQLVAVSGIEDVAVVRDGKRRRRQRGAVRLPARRPLIAVLLHARVHDELGQGKAAVDGEDARVLAVVLKAEARFDRDGQRRALADVAQERLERVRVAQQAGAPALGDDGPRGAPQVEVDLRVAHLGEQLRRPHELVGVLGEQLRDDVQPLVVRRVDLLEVLAAEGRAHAGRREERRVVSVERAEALGVDTAEHVSRDALHGPASRSI